MTGGPRWHKATAISADRACDRSKSEAGSKNQAPSACGMWGAGVLSAFGNNLAAIMQSGRGDSCFPSSQQQSSTSTGHFPSSETKAMLIVQKFLVTPAVGRMMVIRAKRMEARKRIGHLKNTHIGRESKPQAPWRRNASALSFSCCVGQGVCNPPPRLACHFFAARMYFSTAASSDSEIPAFHAMPGVTMCQSDSETLEGIIGS